MKKITIITACMLLCGLMFTANAQKAHQNPSSLVVMSAEKPITLDGKLNETDWQRRIFNLNYRAAYKPDDGSFSVTGSDLPTKGLTGTTGYTDTTSTQVFFLHYGTDLYIGVKSTDSSICARWGGWEGDGIFSKVHSKILNGDIEFKLMFNNIGTGQDSSKAKFEMSANAPAGAGDGMSSLMPGSIAQDNSHRDSGYTLEMVIHLDKLGYAVTDTVDLALTIMDPDYYTRTSDESSAPATVQFYKSWWGSEWGIGGKLILGDKPLADAYVSLNAITLDGKLDEADWKNAPSITLAPNSKDATNWWYMQWGDTLANYDDRSTTVVKFLHKGTDLYVGFVSNDSSVCNWSPGWEADGMFMWMRDKFNIPGPSSRQEVKLMYFGDSVGGPAQYSPNGNVPTGGADGISFEFPGTITRTETNGKDKGYSGEIVIHGDKWGYAANDTIFLAIDMWDIDYGSKDVTTPHKPIYAKTWWGSEWVDNTFDKYYMYRGVVLSSTVVQVDEDKPTTVPATFSLSQNYPNPFNPSTTISYGLPRSENVTLTVYDILGRSMATLADGVQNAGMHSVSFDANNFSSGVYFYELKAGSFTQMKKMILLK